MSAVVHLNSNARFPPEVEWNVQERLDKSEGAKLDMDLCPASGLRLRRRCGVDEEQRRDLARRLFALIMMKLEDATDVAARGQGREISLDAADELALALRAFREEIITLSDAARVSLESPSTSGR